MLAARDRRHERERRARRRGRRHRRSAAANGERLRGTADDGNRNGSNMASLLGADRAVLGRRGLLLTMPRQGLGQAAIAAVADEEQLKRFGGKWAAMAITEPEAGSDSAAIRTTARSTRTTRRIRPQRREDLRHLRRSRRADRRVGDARPRRRARGAIKSFVVERDNPGLKLDRLEHKLGIRASDTANFVLDDCRVPKENLLGSPEIETEARLRRRDADVRQHPAARRRDGDRRRPRVSRAHPRAAHRGRRRDRLRRRRRTARPRPPPSSSRWSPTGRPPGC